MEPDYSKVNNEDDFQKIHYEFMKHLVDPYLPKIHQMKKDFFLQSAECHNKPYESEDDSLLCEQKAFEKIQQFDNSLQDFSNSEANNLMKCIQEKCIENKEGKVENPICFGICLQEFTIAMKEHVKQLLS